MRRLIYLVLIAGAALFSGFGFADDQDQALELRKAGEILPLERILDISRAEIDGRVLAVELEREDGILIYELEILDQQGRVWELKLNAADGALIERELE